MDIKEPKRINNNSKIKKNFFKNILGKMIKECKIAPAPGILKVSDNKNQNKLHQDYINMKRLKYFGNARRRRHNADHL